MIKTLVEDLKEIKQDQRDQQQVLKELRKENEIVKEQNVRMKVKMEGKE